MKEREMFTNHTGFGGLIDCFIKCMSRYLINFRPQIFCADFLSLTNCCNTHHSGLSLIHKHRKSASCLLLCSTTVLTWVNYFSLVVDTRECLWFQGFSAVLTVWLPTDHSSSYSLCIAVFNVMTFIFWLLLAFLSYYRASGCLRCFSGLFCILRVSLKGGNRRRQATLRGFYISYSVSAKQNQFNLNSRSLWKLRRIFFSTGRISPYICIYPL